MSVSRKRRIVETLKIVVPDDYPPALADSPAEQKLRTLGQLVIHASLAAEQGILVERIRGSDIVINIRSSSRFTANVLSECRGLKHIAVWGVGVDNVDLQACKALGVCVTNTPGYSSETVAECALALALAVARRIPRNDRSTRDGQWSRDLVLQLSGKVLGIVGAGPIAQRVMGLGKAMGMQVIAWTFHPSEERARKMGVQFVALDELMRKSDVISLHLPLTPQSRGLIGRRELSLMKQTAILVNTARGAIVDEESLIDVLEAKRIYGAGLDVFSAEPLPQANPFVKLDNVVLSPHKGASTLEAQWAGVWMVTENVENWLRGRPTNLVI